MSPKSDEDMYRIVDRADQDQAMDIMNQLVVPIDEPLADEIITRIQASTWAKLGLTQPIEHVDDNAPAISTVTKLHQQPRRHFFRKRKRTIAISIASVLCLAYLVMSSADVRAQIHRAFQFLPGFATVQNTEDQLVQYVLPNPVENLDKAKKITIRGLSIGDKYASATAVGPGVLSIQTLILHNADGKEFVFKTSTVSGSASDWMGSYYHEGPIEVTDHMTLSFEDPNDAVPIQLVKALQADEISELGVTDTHHGVSISALTTFDPAGKTKVTLLPQAPAGMHIVAYGLAPYDYLDKPKLTNIAGDVVAIEREAYSPNPNEFSFEREPAAAEYNLLIPAISAIRTSDKPESFTVPIPQEGELYLNKSITVNGFPIEITKVERVPRSTPSTQFDGLKIYFDMNVDSNAGESLLSFTPDFMKIKPANGMETHFNEQTRAMTYMIVEIKPQDKSYTFYIQEAHTIIRGPWEFQLQ